MRHGRHGRGRAAHAAAPRQGPPAVARLCVPEGDRDGGRAERPGPRRLPAQAHRRPRRVRARHAGTRRCGDIAARLQSDPRRARPRGGRLVHGQPRRLQLQPHAVGEGIPRRARQPALLLRRLAGREQPLRGLGAAVRVAAAGADPRPQPHRLPLHGRRQPARLARLGAVRAARARAAATPSSTGAAGSSSSTRGARRPRASSSTSRSVPTRTPGCCSRCSR